MIGTLLIRADASTHIGTGHVMRCLALAQAWQDRGGRACLATHTLSAGLSERVRSAGLELLPYPDVALGSPADAEATRHLAQELGAAWLVADGYHFADQFQAALQGQRLLLIDDYGHAQFYLADLVLNQNSYAEPTIYAQRSAATRVLLGSDYALIRREFWPWRDWQRQHEPIGKRLLVTLGGADPENVTLKVLHALDACAELEVVVVVGAHNSNSDYIRAFVADKPALRLRQNVEDMPHLMAWADLALAASGSTCWELAFMGLPALVFAIADNQRLGAAHLHEHGVVHNLGWHADLIVETVATHVHNVCHAVEQREAMSQRGRRLVDGKGGARVVQAMLVHGLTLRRATLDDAQLLWEWANEPRVREASFHSAPIPWPEHLCWFQSKLASETCVQFIALDAMATPVGQIRFDLAEDQALTSISVAAAYRGMGYSAAIIRLGVEELLRCAPVDVIHALVKVENQPSIRAFQQAWFHTIAEELHQGHKTIRLMCHGKKRGM